jgi:hypothetical protein
MSLLRSLRKPSTWSLQTKVISGAVGAVMAGATAYAATNWVVGLQSGSSAEAQASSISNLTVSAVASPAPVNLLYPGANGDAVLKIANPNGFPVTVTAVQLPTNTTYATAFSDSGLSSAVAGCAAGTPSGVTWNFATGTTGTSHSLTTPLTVAANGNLSVTLTSDVSMATTAPAACAGSYFSLPSLTGVTASGGAATATTGPATDAWTS